MALKSSDAIVFKSLSASLKMMLRLNPDIDAVKDAMAQNISEFEAASGHLVRFSLVDGEWQMVLVDGKKDFIRIRKPNDESKVLRTRINSVQIEVKIQKSGEYEFDNEWIAKALKDLAAEIEGIDLSLVEQDACDVRKLVAGDLSDSDADTDSESDEEQEDKDDKEVALTSQQDEEE
ncbi:hypothetical protein [Aeromonas sp. MrichA-1]|uniref:hypothetical protein n=1 Tax=Aeromonas sp. MrichA-1 TaxID=2823362 RepID=UPI001B33D7E3|nr:hypothetical protein [Aeromonas sp. MrichA-1]MBP4081583.1 hypothetical protein [Aeromonas sp. MrichA-1]